LLGFAEPISGTSGDFVDLRILAARIHRADRLRILMEHLSDANQTVGNAH
jgi:hypothetical protein